MTYTPTQVLRLKRPRTSLAPSTLHVIPPPSKRLRVSDALASLSMHGPQAVRFRKMSDEEVAGMETTAVHDVDMSQLRRAKRKREEEDDDEGGGEEGGVLTCNGEEMERAGGEVFDLYVREGGGDLEDMYLLAEDLPEFEWGESDEDDEEDLDGESIDYPSTPESSGGSESEASVESGRRRFGVWNGGEGEEWEDEGGEW